MNNEKTEQNDKTPDEQEPTPATTGTTAPAAKLDIETFEGPEDVVAWLKENGMPVLVGVVIAALAFAGWSAYKNHERAVEISAQSMLFNSQSSSQFMEIMTKYPGAPSAPLAELSLASQQFDEGMYDMARGTFSSFIAKRADHPLVAAATLGLVQCDEAQLKLGDALKGYENFLKANPDSFLYAQAVLGRGRCLEQMGRYDDARACYEDFIAAHPKDPWSQRAESALLYVAKAKRASEHKQAQPPQTSVPAPVAPVVGSPAAPAPAPVPVAPAAPAATPAPAPAAK